MGISGRYQLLDQLYNHNCKVRTAIETTEDITATGNRTWKTGITDWIPTEFGSTYLVNVYVQASADAAGAEINLATKSLLLVVVITMNGSLIISQAY